MYGVKYLRRKHTWFATPHIHENPNNKKKKISKKPGWDSTQQDLSKFKLAPEELEQRKKERISKNLPKVRAIPDDCDSASTCDSDVSEASCDLRDVFSKVAHDLQRQQGSHPADPSCAPDIASTQAHDLAEQRHASNAQGPQHSTLQDTSRPYNVSNAEITTITSSIEKPLPPSEQATAPPQCVTSTENASIGSTSNISPLEAEISDLKLQVSSLTKQVTAQAAQLQEYTSHTSTIISRLQSQLQELFNTLPKTEASPAAYAQYQHGPPSNPSTALTSAYNSSLGLNRTGAATVQPQSTLASTRTACTNDLHNSLPSELHPEPASASAQQAAHPDCCYQTLASTSSSQSTHYTRKSLPDMRDTSQLSEACPSSQYFAPALEEEASLPSFRDLRKRFCQPRSLSTMAASLTGNSSGFASSLVPAVTSHEQSLFPPESVGAQRYALYSGQDHLLSRREQTNMEHGAIGQGGNAVGNGTVLLGNHFATSTQRLHNLQQELEEYFPTAAAREHLTEWSRSIYNPPSNYLAPPPTSYPTMQKAASPSKTLSFNALTSAATHPQCSVGAWM